MIFDIVPKTPKQETNRFLYQQSWPQIWISLGKFYQNTTISKTWSIYLQGRQSKYTV